MREQRYNVQVRQASQVAITGHADGEHGTAPPANETLTAEGLRNAVVAAG